MSYVPVASADEKFRDRMRRVERRHSQLARGYLLTVNHDGLVVPEPKPAMRRFPLRGLVAAALAVLVFKACAVAYMGPANYDGKIAMLVGGTAPERMAGFLMQDDPVTRALADKLTRIVE